ncbi:integrase core domain-containing protein [Paenibacillus popilliae]|uniref:integrase core domain-containing protein n=1 Tax=Paenibacillus popilliae TaxID=78057 RepID=UPI000B80D32F
MGKSRATDNSRTERFFRSFKYECIYLNEFENLCALRQGIVCFVHFYNENALTSRSVRHDLCISMLT